MLFYIFILASYNQWSSSISTVSQQNHPFVNSVHGARVFVFLFASTWNAKRTYARRLSRLSMKKKKGSFIRQIFRDSTAVHYPRVPSWNLLKYLMRASLRYKVNAELMLVAPKVGLKTDADPVSRHSCTETRFIFGVIHQRLVRLCTWKIR